MIEPRRLLVGLIRQLASWGGANPPSNGWREPWHGHPLRIRPVKRTRIAAQDRERHETRRIVARLMLWLPASLVGLFYLVQLQTPEQMALHRLKRQAMTNTVSTPEPRLETQKQLTISFHDLAWFDFDVTPDIYDGRTDPASASARATEQIPESVRRLDGSAVALQGFMRPLKLEKGKAVEWLLCRDQSDCCFGTTPRMNHWVLVRSAQGVKPALGQPVTCSGKLHVGEMRNDGFLTGIYQMDAETACLKE